ncbi:MAG: secondary thiamine-phosphate synthase enzyme [Omnitrophica bacterium RBG_13_46_9]|nr:MAG: secondary thiamine-phosphate synthase enzyme [Omnitrophica bacterium RBG_13_46_9]
MTKLMISTKYIKLKSRGETDIINITLEVEAILQKAKPRSGIVVLFVPGATGALTTIEYESGLVSDLKEAFEKLAPRDGEYAHNLRWSDGNGFAHVRASLLGPSVTVPFLDGKLTLGTWQQIIFIDFDNRPRTRELIVQIIGE